LIVAGVALVRDRLAPLVAEPHSNVAFTCARSFTPAPNTWVAQAASGMTSVVLALAVWRRSACSLEPLPSPREWRPHLAALVLHCSIEEVSSSTSTALCLQRQGLVVRSLNRRLLRDCGLYSEQNTLRGCPGSSLQESVLYGRGTCSLACRSRSGARNSDDPVAAVGNVTPWCCLRCSPSDRLTVLLRSPLAPTMASCSRVGGQAFSTSLSWRPYLRHLWAVRRELSAITSWLCGYRGELGGISRWSWPHREWYHGLSARACELL